MKGGGADQLPFCGAYVSYSRTEWIRLFLLWGAGWVIYCVYKYLPKTEIEHCVCTRDGQYRAAVIRKEKKSQAGIGPVEVAMNADSALSGGRSWNA